MNGIKLPGIILLLLVFTKATSQQLRLGDNPNSMEKSAVLDLVSTRQGLLLPRISDSALINSLTPPDGMIIYYVPGARLMIRKQGSWHGLATVGGMDTSDIGNFSTKTRSLLSAGPGMSYNSATGVMSNTGVLSVNGSSGVISMNTDQITEGPGNKYFTDSRSRSALAASAPITYNASSGNISIDKANTIKDGYLSAADWNTFNNKQAAGNYLTGLSGDVSASGPGSAAATISNGAVSFSKMQSITTNKLLGSGASGTAIREISLGSGLSFTGSTLNTVNNGTVTSFSTGNLSGLFTSSVSTPTSTPALSFSLNAQSANTIFAAPDGSSGTPAFRSLVKADLPSSIVYNNQSNTYTAGSKQVFAGSATYADIRLTGSANDPATLDNGDIWYHSSSGSLRYRSNGVTRTVLNTSESQTLTNKTISGSANTLTNIPNSSLDNSTIGLTVTNSGNSVSVSNSPASLGGSLTLNLPMSYMKRTSVVFDLPSISGNSSLSYDVSVAGATVGDNVIVNPGGDLTNSNGTGSMVIGYAYVSAADTVTIRFATTNSTSTNVPSLTYYITVFR